MQATLTFEGGRQRTGPGMWTKTKARLKQIGASAVSAAFTPHKASLKRLAEMPLTVVGAVFADFAAFHIPGHGWGWAITAVTLIIVEQMISDDDTRRH